jgi:6-phosphogluconate dehydrogenase (decarboxylating)
MKWICPMYVFSPKFAFQTREKILKTRSVHPFGFATCGDLGRGHDGNVTLDQCTTDKPADT